MKKVYSFVLIFVFTFLVMLMPAITTNAQTPTPTVPKRTCANCNVNYQKCLTMTTHAVCDPLFQQCKDRYCKADGSDVGEMALGEVSAMDDYDDTQTWLGNLWASISGAFGFETGPVSMNNFDIYIDGQQVNKSPANKDFLSSKEYVVVLVPKQIEYRDRTKYAVV